MKNINYVVAMTTVSSEAEAETLAKKIVSAKLAACVQVQNIKSFYMWKGEACAEPEWLLLAKGRAVQFEELEAFIRANHAYETPEVIQVPVTAGSASYLKWIDEVTG